MSSNQPPTVIRKPSPERPRCLLRTPASSSQPDSSAIAERIFWLSMLALAAILATRFLCLALVVLTLVVLAWLAPRPQTSGAYGSARWATRRDVQSAGLLGPTGMILGRAAPVRSPIGGALLGLLTAPWPDSASACRRFRSALLFRYDDERPLIRLRDGVHFMAVAPPGAGKGVGIVIPNMLDHRGSAVVIDPKGEIYATTARARARLGNRVVRLDPLNVCGRGGACLNPLDSIHPDSPMVADQAAAVAQALVVQSGHETDPHWNQCSILGITAAIVYVAVYAAPEDRNLNAVADLLCDPDAFCGMVEMMRDEAGELAPQGGESHAHRLLRRLGGTMAAWRERELASIMSCIGRHLTWVHGPQVEANLAVSTFDPRDLIREDVTVYLILPPQYLTTLSRLLRLWLTTMCGAIIDGGAQESRRVLFMLDEVGNIGAAMPSLYQAITLGRGYGMRVCLILQSLGQLKTLFPQDGEHQTVEASIDTRVLFGIRNYETAEAVSNYIGQATVGVESQTVSKGSSQTGSILGAFLGEGKISHSTNDGTSRTMSEVGRKLLMPDELLQLHPDTALILTKGVPPIMASLAKYYESPELAGLAAATGRREQSGAAR